MGLIRNFKLDMIPGGMPLTINVNQYDSDFTFVFELCASTGTLSIPSGATAGIRGRKTDGTIYSVAAALNVDTKKVTVTGNAQMTAAAGINVFELTIYNGNYELNTANFILRVEQASADKDALPSKSVIRELVNVIDRTDEIIQAANKADSAKTEIAALSQSAQTAAANASTSEANAAASAQLAEDTVNNAIAAIRAEGDAVTQSAQETSAGIAEIKRAALADMTSGKDAAVSAVTEKQEEGVAAVDSAYNSHVDDIDAKAQQIARTKTGAEATAAQAMSQATEANVAAEEAVTSVRGALERIDILEGLIRRAVMDGYVDDENVGQFINVDGESLFSMSGIGGGGGSGGGSGSGGVSAKFTAENMDDWISKTIAEGSSCPASFKWSSIEDEMETGPGSLDITVNNIQKASYNVPQGVVTVDLADYLSAGANTAVLRISDTYGQWHKFNRTITVAALSISSTFDTSSPFDGAILFNYTPVGAVAKTIYFVVDGDVIATYSTTVSGRQLTQAIPAQAHGAHSLLVYFEAEINGQTVRSNELYYEFISVEDYEDDTIIASPFNLTTVPQYTTLQIPHTVFTPGSLTSEVSYYAGGALLSTQTVDRSEQSYSYRAVTPGTLNFRIESGGTVKAFTISVTESEIDVEAEDQNLELFLTAQGRSNNEADPWTWVSSAGGNTVSAALTGFTGASDGWSTDTDGATCLRVANGARVQIPYEIFGTDVRQTGLTVEIEYATRNVADYSVPVFSCMSGSRGLIITPQQATLRSEQTELSMQYREGKHIRVAYTIDKRAENRLVKSFIDGKVARATQYPADDDFSQVSPVGIEIGGDGCTIDVYTIRVYSNNLTMKQVMDNWIADTQDGAAMLDRYTRNQVYDAYGEIVPSQLPKNLPYMILEAEELPQYKGDKKVISGSYTDPAYPSKSFTFAGMQINVQGTSSAPYYRKNYDEQYKEGFETSTGHQSTYRLRENSVPTARFVTKADVASSESANNTQLVRLYNDICPYKTPEMLEDSRVRWGIDGFPIVVFWRDTATDTLKFLGKYNFNFPKRFPEGYGYTA